ncbi:MAG TPA: pyridoxal phosphate-dependent aminotransferase [Bryobacteraceae bacterium]|nr:pyridoxal phosphate-dependent aminotransferase [Bryobacteraceae bacterium]HPU73843.1 pyridoxal phosphate-dependent aminotransferase [Bryobacteraceae bacterium]
MIVARSITEQIGRASWIRRMFEEGDRLRAERGPENVFDFTLGNPEVQPPEQVTAALARIAAENRPRSHGYMPNAGYPQVREIIARRLAQRTGLPYDAGHIIMTVGSSGALNTVLKAMLDPGDEVMVLVPYFPEYRFYIENHAGRIVEVETTEDFLPDPARIAAALTPRTKALILNSPNNPTGVVYPARVLDELETVLRGTEVTVLSDEPYRALVFDGCEVPETAVHITRTVTAISWSKSQAISGERIGYLAISPRLPGGDQLREACTFTNRILGFINAPAIWQWVAAEAGECTIDVAAYQHKRDVLVDALTRIGYEVTKPQGTFYLFPKSPIPDDLAFIRLLLQEGVMAVPGSGFGRPGYFRLSLTVPLETVKRSISGFERAFKAARP